MDIQVVSTLAALLLLRTVNAAISNNVYTSFFLCEYIWDESPKVELLGTRENAVLIIL